MNRVGAHVNKLCGGTRAKPKPRIIHVRILRALGVSAVNIFYGLQVSGLRTLNKLWKGHHCFQAFSRASAYLLRRRFQAGFLGNPAPAKIALAARLIRKIHPAIKVTGFVGDLHRLAKALEKATEARLFRRIQAY